MHFISSTLGHKKSKSSYSDKSECSAKEQPIASPLPSEGFQVTSVLGGSPALEAGLIPFFDLIIAVDTQSFVSSDNSKDYTDFLRDFSESHVDTPISLLVWNLKILATREVLLTPNRRWGGPGTLGCSVRWSSAREARSKCVHVIHVMEGGAVSGFLKAERDYIVGFRHPWEQYATLVENERTLQVVVREALQRKQGEVAFLFFLIYDNEANNLREVQIPIPPSRKVGLAVAHGIAHVIPTRKCSGSSGEEMGSSVFPSSLSPVSNTSNSENAGTNGLPVFLVSQLSSSASPKNEVFLSCDEQKHSEVVAPATLANVDPDDKLNISSNGDLASELIVDVILPTQSDSIRIESASLLTPLRRKNSDAEEFDGEKKSLLIPKTEDHPTHDNSDTSKMEEEKKSVAIIPPESVCVTGKSSISEQSTLLGNPPSSLLPLSGAMPLFPSPSSDSGFRCSENGIPNALPPSRSSSHVDVFASPSSSSTTKSVSKRENKMSPSVENVSLLDPVQFYLMEPGFVPVTSPPPILFSSCGDGAEKNSFPSPFVLAPGGVESATLRTVVPFSDETHFPLDRSAENSLPKDFPTNPLFASACKDLEQKDEVTTMIESKITDTATVELLPSSVLLENDLSVKETRNISEGREDMREKKDISNESNSAEEKRLPATIPPPLHFPLYEEVRTFSSNFPQLFSKKK